LLNKWNQEKCSICYCILIVNHSFSISMEICLMICFMYPMIKRLRLLLARISRELNMKIQKMQLSFLLLISKILHVCLLQLMILSLLLTQMHLLILMEIACLISSYRSNVSSRLRTLILAKL